VKGVIQKIDSQVLDVEIHVIDTGVGIPPECIPKLGTPFFMVNKEKSGTGLGLSICKRILTAMDSSLTISSIVSIVCNSK
jgi:signal transduction histidine kinase